AASEEPVRPAERKAAGTPRQQHSEARTTASSKRSGAATGAATGAAAGAAGAAAASSGSGTAAAAGSGGGSAAGGGAAGGSSSSGGAGTDDRDLAATRKPFLWLVLGLVIVAAIVVGIVVINLNSGEDESAPVTETSTPSQEPTETETKKTPKPEPPTIASVESLDPQGDGEEHDSETENVIPKTEGSWNTDRYNSAEFGNLKSGVGLLIEFEDESTVSKVKVKSANSGGKFEIRDGDDPEDAEVIGEGVFDADEGATIEFDE